MMKAFGEGARDAAAKAGLPAPKLIAVTILTSLDAAAVRAVGLEGSPREAALRLAILAKESGLDGVVCSPEEIETIRAASGGDFLLVVPGVRPRGEAAGDQRRVATPARRDPRGRGPSRRRPPDHRRVRPRGGRARHRRRDRLGNLSLRAWTWEWRPASRSPSAWASERRRTASAWFAAERHDASRTG